MCQGAGQQQSDILTGGLSVLRTVGAQLHAEHPIRKRLESALGKLPAP